jgi:hypothetical protein
MIVKEFYMIRNDGVNLFLTKSTDGLKIRKVGTNEIYDEAIDVEIIGYQYEETDELIESDEDSKDMAEIEQKAAAYDILMGVSE